MADPRDERPVGRGFGAGYSIVAAGFTFVLSILFFMWIGSLVDRRLGTGPLFLLIGMAIGFGAGGYSAWLKVTAETRGPGK